MANYSRSFVINDILNNLLKVELNLHDSLQDKVLNRVQQLRLNIKEDVGDFLHNLDHRIDTEDQVRAAVNLCPESLMVQNEGGRFPIQVAVRTCFSHAFVPLLAELAIEHKQEVGGPDKRGGLLMEDTFARKTLTVLEIFVCVGHRDDPYFDVDSLETLKKLKTKELLHLADIRRYKLLLRPNSGCKSRIEFLADWNPEALDMCPTRGCYPIFLVISKDVSRFKMMLKAGFKHFPNELGFLFANNAGDNTACTKAIENFGKEKILDIIQAIIPSGEDLPILHFVMRSVPDLLNDFALRYPSATYLRDDKGRLLHHVAMASGRTMRNNAMFYLQMTDDKLEEQDPETGLFPFMLMASGEKSDLYSVFYLLRKNPSVLERQRGLVKEKRKASSTRNSKKTRVGA